MSEVVKGTSGAPDDAASGGHKEGSEKPNAASGGSKKDQSEDFVSRDTYLKTLGEVKSLKSKLAEVVEKFEATQQEKLSLEGNKDQLIEALKSKADKAEAEKRKLAGTFVERVLKSQFETEALKHGIAKPEIIHKLVDLNAFVDSVDTETFQADEVDIKSTVEKIKEEYPMLFTKESPKINNKTPATEGQVGEKKKIDFGKLTKEEANKLAEEIDRLEGKRSSFVLG